MNGLLEIMIGPAVFLQIATMEKNGGPSPADMAKAEETSEMLGEHGDILLHGGGKPGECADLFNRTALAMLMGHTTTRTLMRYVKNTFDYHLKTVSEVGNRLENIINGGGQSAKSMQIWSPATKLGKSEEDVAKETTS